MKRIAYEHWLALLASIDAWRRRAEEREDPACPLCLLMDRLRADCDSCVIGGKCVDTPYDEWIDHWYRCEIRPPAKCPTCRWLAWEEIDFLCGLARTVEIVSRPVLGRREKTNDPIRDNYVTWRDVLDPAMKIQTQEEADEYFAKVTVHLMCRFDMPKSEAEILVRTNLGYWAGYYDHATRLRVERLFNCQHPILGKAADGEPTPEAAFVVGVDWARKHLRKEP